MTGVPRQLTLELPLAPRFGDADFLVARSNHVAYATIERWPHWHGRVLLVTGPTGSGKSHLAAIWKRRAHAEEARLADLTRQPVSGIASRAALLIEDIDQGVDGSGELPETALFHLVNLMQEHGHYLVLTARGAPASLGLKTPDLLSRLRLAMNVTLGAPDDALVKDVLIKLFADRQLSVGPAVVDFIALHIDRSLDAARSAVDRLDREALARGGKITRRMAAQVLAVNAPEEDGEV